MNSVISRLLKTASRENCHFEGEKSMPSLSLGKVHYFFCESSFEESDHISLELTKSILNRNNLALNYKKFFDDPIFEQD